MNKIKLELEISDDEFMYLVSQARKFGYKREERSTWNDAEFKRAIRYRLLQVIGKELKR